jgi:universal stress protein E
MKRIQTIAVGVAEMRQTDPGIAPAGQDPVLAPAAELAERLGATLHVVRACERSGPGGVLAGSRRGAATLPRGSVEIEQLLWDQTRHFANADRIHVHVLQGDPAIQLCAFAEDVGAQLLIVGATRRGALWHNLLGSTAERVLERAPAPVLVMRHPFRGDVHRVLLTTDLSEHGTALHEVAVDTVESMFGGGSLELRALLVVGYDPATAARMSREFLQNAARSELRQYLGARRARVSPVTACVRLGNPSTEIVRAASEWPADLLVLGSHGRKSPSSRMLGSTAAATLTACSGNALVIPTSVVAPPPERATEESRRPGVYDGFPGTQEYTEAGVALSTT